MKNKQGRISNADKGVSRNPPYFDVGIMQGSVEHNDGEGEDVASVDLVRREDGRVAVAVSLRKRFHHSVDLPE